MDISCFGVRVAFLSGLVKSYFYFLLSYDYPLRVLIPFKVIAKASSTRGILNTFEARETLTMKTSYISHALILKLKCFSRDRSMSGKLLKWEKAMC